MASPKIETLAKKYLTAKQLSERWGDCSHMFIERRLASDPNFPKPLRLGGRLRLFPLDQIESYERSKVNTEVA
jgi:predicted DNA-binding transcriptional regulator AlpA